MKASPTANIAKPHFYGLDIVRTLSFMAICIFHYLWNVWYEPTVTVAERTALWVPIEIYGRIFSQSGHTILLLSSFLFGYAKNTLKATLRLLVFSGVAWIIFCLFEYGENEIFWVWDIYALIFVGFLISYLVSKSFRSSLFLVLLGFILLWIPFSQISYLQQTSLVVKQALIGICELDLADWPLLPWIGLIFFGYGLGRIVNINPPIYDYLRRGSKKEIIFWVIIFIFSAPELGRLYKVGIGPLYACEIFHVNPYVFWANILPAIFFMRVSLLNKFNQVLEDQGWVRALAKLRINTHFGLAYVTHYLLIVLWARKIAPNFATSEFGSVLILLSILPTTELILRSGLCLRKYLKR